MKNLRPPTPGAAPPPEPIDAAAIEAEAREAYQEFLKGVRPRQADFHERLAEAAGIAPGEEEEILQLIEQRRRLKRGR